jgi:N-alpha-acetyltransferase 15/16, NatA auxiliary subunit
MVVTKPDVLVNWTSYMVAAFIVKDYNLCVEIWASI